MLAAACFTINLPSCTYPVHIGRQLFADENLLRQQVMAKHALVVTNETIAPLYLAKVQQALADIQCDTLILPDGEIYKDQTHLFAIYDVLLNHQHHRDTTLFALGGGVVGDITGFAAATYQRGVRLIQLPTTLLAQVDSSVGGKTAINLPQGKNMVGSFYQPHAVIMDLATLETLPLRELRAGLAEVIKYGLLVGGDFWEQLPTQTQQLLSQSWTSDTWEALSRIVTRCCQIKAEIVRDDERDYGRRALLNLGHTFAHALETATTYQQWLHGEAVAIGLYCASVLSYELGYLKLTEVEQVRRLLQQTGLPYTIPTEIDLDNLQALMWQDKKVQGNTLPFVVLRGFGNGVLERGVTQEQIKSVLTYVCGSHHHE